MARHKKPIARAVLGIAAILLTAQVADAATVFTDRILFEAQLGANFRDDYDPGVYNSDPNRYIFSDSDMSGVLGTVSYSATGFADLNVVANGYYCAGCNGSFLLDFRHAASPAGVYGAGIVYRNGDLNDDPNARLLYSAFITYGNNSTETISLPGSDGDAFFGIVSLNLIRSIAFGLPGGMPTTDGYFSLDSLTLGNAPAVVPIPATLPLLAGGLLGLAALAWRRKT